MSIGRRPYFSESTYYLHFFPLDKKWVRRSGIRDPLMVKEDNMLQWLKPFLFLSSLKFFNVVILILWSDQRDPYHALFLNTQSTFAALYVLIHTSQYKAICKPDWHVTWGKSVYSSYTQQQPTFVFNTHCAIVFKALDFGLKSRPPWI